VLSSLLVIAVVIAVGTRASDGLQVRQQEVILQNLPEPEAVVYYQLLRRRVRRVAVLRVLAFLSLVTLVYSYKHRVLGGQGAAPVVRVEK
jgi:hypothetical protein